MVGPKHRIYAHILISTKADSTGGTLQIRPHKDFAASKGRHHVLSLRLLTELPAEQQEDQYNLNSDSGTGIRDAYDFMRGRKEVNGDPEMQRWNAAIRLANFASVEAAPLCVSFR